jgi:hypothetical protein
MIKDMNDVELEKNEVALFENQFIEAFKQMAAISKQKKDLDAKEKKFKEQLEKAMDEFQIKSINNDYVRITRIAENPGKTVIDVDELQKKEPELFNDLLKDYPKISGKKKAYVKFEVK